MGGNIKNVHALTRIYDLLLWIIPVLEKFPGPDRLVGPAEGPESCCK